MIDNFKREARVKARVKFLILLSVIITALLVYFVSAYFLLLLSFIFLFYLYNV